MGLAIAQVRLLALTTRKADIELQMQVDSKRKQMLTRQSTLLSQEYYSRLQNANIQYATSSGYEDVNYNYLMGQTSQGEYTVDFLNQIISGSDYGIAQKTENRMILTNQYGEVVANNDLALIAQKAKDSYSDQSIATQTCHAILDLVNEKHNQSTIYQELYRVLNTMNINDVIRYMEIILENGGYKNGGIIYSDDEGGTYYNSREALENSNGSAPIQPQAGYCYVVYNSLNQFASIGGKYISGHFYDGSSFTSLDVANAKRLGNLISYFGPMLSAAIQNGTTAEITSSLNTGAGYSQRVLSDGLMHYYNNSGQEVTKGEACTYSVSSNNSYEQASRVENLQAGFKSGIYQLCMVTDPTKGIYHKNTTLDYFTHMNYVVEKTDSSAREEITAWFNAEQAAISEKETYWDEEIQNLSTELNSINTEIESVKTLKSNAIKSVFDWGGN